MVTGPKGSSVSHNGQQAVSCKGPQGRSCLGPGSGATQTYTQTSWRRQTPATAPSSNLISFRTSRNGHNLSNLFDLKIPMPCCSFYGCVDWHLLNHILAWAVSRYFMVNGSSLMMMKQGKTEEGRSKRPCLLSVPLWFSQFLVKGAQSTAPDRRPFNKPP